MVSTLNHSNQTALSIAVQRRFAGAVKLLIHYEADLYSDEEQEINASMERSNIDASGAEDVLVNDLNSTALTDGESINMLKWAARNGCVALLEPILFG